MAKARRSAVAAAFFLVLASGAGAAPDLYIRDTPADTGVEPNPDLGPMWISEDIWVRRDPDPSYSPHPFPSGSPSWTPLPHQDPEYRDPRYGNPNYVYVRVTNRGTTASTGADFLKLYWAKASTGLAWPAQWEDYVSACPSGPPRLYGIEITKERENAATATPAERALYKDAILDAGTRYCASDLLVSYWHKQKDIHLETPRVSYPLHGSLAFLPWHRELLNRFEVLLQEAHPTVKLLYWDWTKDPVTGGFDYFQPSFMGYSGRGERDSISIGAPFLPALGPAGAVTRRLEAGPPPVELDATILAQTPYAAFRTRLEDVNHNPAHAYVGGHSIASPGTLSDSMKSPADPFFFLLHGNVDRLWAKWQRDPAALSRRDPATTFAPDSASSILTDKMVPWNGATTVEPYTTAGGYIFDKNAKHPSVVFPPIYDDARLTVPKLFPGQSVILEIPFFPPDPSHFSCFSEAGHLCLLARVLHSDSSPFGMTTPEVTSVAANTKANNNIAWKNVKVVDHFSGSAIMSSILVRNVFGTAVATTLELAAVAEANGASFFDFGEIRLELQPELYDLWITGGAQGAGIDIENGSPRPRLRVAPGASLENILLPANAAYFVKVHFELRPDYPAPEGTSPRWDLIQLGTPSSSAEVVGGERFVVDFNQLTLSPRNAQWRYRTTYPGQGWQTAVFGAGAWPEGKAPLGFGDDPATRLDPPPPPPGTAYFRRSFEVDDPGLVRDLYLRLRADDAAVVYLNGTEVHRTNLPPQGPILPATPATAAVEGIEEEVYAAIPIPAGLLAAGANLIAAEVHRTAGPDADLTFDLELAANLGQAPVEPAVAFAAHLRGGQFQAGQPIPIEVDAFGGAGRHLAIQVETGTLVLASATDAPLVHSWTGAPLGTHRLKATAVDRGVVAEAFATINVVDNMPPIVHITSPADQSLLPLAPNYAFTAEASDPLGAIDQVELYIKDATSFVAPTRLLGTATTAPYTFQATDLEPGHWMVWAIAYDTQGGYSGAPPIHIGIDHPHH